MPYAKQGGITVDAAHELPVAEGAHELQDKANHQGRKIEASMMSRMNRMAAIKPEQPATNKLPALDGLDGAEHVQNVFRHPTHPRKHKF